MSERPRLDFWHEFASTYSYIAAMRVEAAAARHDVEIVWRPFLLGPIFGAQGLTDSPFNIYADKGRYMWRDMARLCDDYGLAFRKPSAFPRNGLLAARVATVGVRDGWGPAFIRGVYEANFVHDQDITDAAVLAPIVIAAGGDVERALADASTDATKTELRRQTDEAQSRGVFGAPTLTTADGELFWGHDRLEQALLWAKKHNH
ncbi:MAG: 2-hydroxychromene-2-carboxylate isomerase [Alphaproteobacteria bacterium]|nr:2-hydroxychromene-2-carboxylate isomerase [Alphaproteobacteria bacterium]